MRAEEQQSRVFYELSSMIVHILRAPPLSLPSTVGTATSSSSSSTSRQPSPSPSLTQMPAASPTAFASLFLGISLALMLFGSVTFAIGFVLMPLVMALVLFFSAVEILFHLSQFGRSIFSHLLLGETFLLFMNMMGTGTRSKGNEEVSSLRL